MPPWKAATPGTIVCLAATILLVLVTVSTPLLKTFYFLSVNVSGSSTQSNVSASGGLKLGTFGFCINDSTCTPTTLGYDLTTSALGVGASSITQLAGLSNSVIKGLTYVLVLHPIAAGLAGIATVLGIVGHIREMAPICIVSATWLAGVGSTISLLAFIFDIIVFTIAKSRINSASSSNGNVSVNTGANYGNAIWMTLAAFLLLAISGCCFRFGTNVARVARGQKRPQPDDKYAYDSRRDALEAEKLRVSEGYGNGSGSRVSGHEKGLPSFAEPRAEAVPLRSMAYDDEDHVSSQIPGRYEDPFARQNIAGVGEGYGRRVPNLSTASATTTTAVARPGGALRSPSHTEPFVGMPPDRPPVPTRSPSPPIPIAPMPPTGAAYHSYDQPASYQQPMPAYDPYTQVNDHVRATSPPQQPLLQPYSHYNSFTSSSSIADANASPSPSYGHYQPDQARASAVPFGGVRSPAPAAAPSIAPTYTTTQDPYASYYGQSQPPTNQYGQRWQ